ncbi:MAG: permease [Myxococcaceae bacterium]|nr:permease [Myxococcaceae bacterium]
MASLVLVAILVGTVVLQAVRPAYRLTVVLGGAALSCLAAALFGVGTTRAIFADVPWDVLVLLVGLGFLTELFVATRVFGVVAAKVTRLSRGGPKRIFLLFTLVMYVASSLVNNLTALLLVLPILLILFKLLGVGKKYLAWTLGVLLVACNLGGAATPIGDFPALLLLGRGVMTFTDYLMTAAPPTLVALAVLVGWTLLKVRPERELVRDPLTTRLSLAVMAALYRRVRLDWRRFLPAVGWLVAMLVAWLVVPPSSGVGPELVCWLGVGAALLSSPKVGENIIRTRVDVEAALFLLALFVMVAAVRQSGLFAAAGQGLAALPIPAVVQLVLFLLAAGVLTGLFSAGPSMAALLDVAEALATRLPPAAVYVGLALSVCAGSSLFLTAATSGPMAQILTERAQLTDEQGERVRFGFFEFLPVGLVAFAIIQTVAVGYALVLVVTRG